MKEDSGSVAKRNVVVPFKGHCQRGRKWNRKYAPGDKSDKVHHLFVNKESEVGLEL